MLLATIIGLVVCFGVARIDGESSLSKFGDGDLAIYAKVCRNYQVGDAVMLKDGRVERIEASLKGGALWKVAEDSDGDGDNDDKKTDVVSDNQIEGRIIGKIQTKNF